MKFALLFCLVLGAAVSSRFDAGRAEDDAGWGRLEAEVNEKEMREKLNQEMQDLLDDVTKLLRRDIQELIFRERAGSEEVEAKLQDLIASYKTIQENGGGNGIDDALRHTMVLLNFLRAVSAELWGDTMGSMSSDLAHWDFNVRGIYDKLKEMINKHVNTEKIKEYLQKFKESELGRTLIESLKEGGKRALIKYLEKLLEADTQQEAVAASERRSLRELWKKVKDFFKKAKLELKEKWFKFGEWVRENFKDEFDDDSESTINKLRDIAHKLLDTWMDVRKEVIAQALEFLRPYKDELGDVYDKLKKIYKEHLE